MRDEIIYNTIKEAIKLIDEIDAMINTHNNIGLTFHSRREPPSAAFKLMQ